jgi:superfamily II DNA or RNA helicase
MSKILAKEGYLLDKTKFTIEAINKIKNELIVQPYMTFKVPNMPIIKYPVYKEDDKYLCIPKFYGLNKLGQPDENHEVNGLIVNYEFKYKPRKTEVIDQINVINTTIDKIKNVGGGLICAGCGAGKTFMGLYIAHHFKVKTLIIVHKTFLLNQWVDRIKEYTGETARIGIIQQNKVDVEDKDIVIGMLQSIAKEKYDNDIFMDFGMVIFDEAHHAPSKYFSKALPIINCKRSLALSATPKRSDKMEKVLYWYLGEICYKAPPNKNDVVKVNIYNYNLEHQKFNECYMKTGDVNRPRTINRIVRLKKRNKFIIKLLFEVMVEDGRQCLILSDRIEHLETRKEKIDEDGRYSCAFYIGGKSQKQLDEASKAQILLGSYGMASEGLDIPSLNTLFMVTPRSKVEQSAGRIVRKIGDVKPLIVDIIDMLPCFKTQGIQRKKLYKKLDYRCTEYDVENNKIVDERVLSKNKKKCKTTINDILECGDMIL